MRTRSTLFSVLAVLCLGSFSIASAEEPNANKAPAATQVDPAQIDRDGKKICGFSIMSDSERGGYRNLMHKSAKLEDRDAIRADHCARMRERAKERGVPFEE